MGSLIGEVLTWRLPTLTVLILPAATTPFSRASRTGASHGSALASALAVGERLMTT